MEVVVLFLKFFKYHSKYIFFLIIFVCINLRSMTQTIQDIFVEHASNDRYDAAEKLLKENLDINSRNSMGFTALMQSAINEKSSIVDKLIKAGADLEVKDTRGYTAIEICTFYKLKEAIELLASRGANIEKVEGLDHYIYRWAKKGRALHRLFQACQNNNIDEILFINRAWGLKKGLKDIKDLNGFSTLHYAIEADNAQLAIALLSICPELIEVEEPRKDGLNPIELAIKNDKQVLKAFTHVATSTLYKENTSFFGKINAYIQANKAKSFAIAIISASLAAILVKFTKNYLNRYLKLSIKDAINLDPKKLENKRIVFKDKKENKRNKS